ncbi:hypothetical protein PLESTB_000740100 [Pleodorina starrii]|uniref:Xaa-Pro dipeptidase n=1 Tax=Pleodorina starrii TaxID=330485 RepID=A0A9W6BKF5_9CHLO|nr:hypothetical protein PLESTM_000184400 [Pleodorina starrii]GLC53395.1 hypothetical protein PLESTB_000740100 [Pleodorina starrii]GLC67135.1 hypothetical protein PLESTF_000521100 [Pleodorina starrii]
MLLRQVPGLATAVAQFHRYRLTAAVCRGSPFRPLGSRQSSSTSAANAMAAISTDAPIEADTYHMGPGTLRISRKVLHGKLRARLLERLQAALPEEKRGLVLLEGGKETHLYSSDGEPLFRQESYMHYLFGVQECDWLGALCVKTGCSLLFMPRLPESYAVWMGRLKGPEEFKAKYGVDAVHYVDEMPDVIRGMAPPCLHVLHGVNTDSGLTVSPPQSPAENIPLETGTLYDIITECRVIKIPEEIEIIRYANVIGSAGHIAAMRSAKPGVMEYCVESAFLHHCYTAGGCRSPMFTPIAASGTNAAILHYGHAGAPNDRQTGPGELLLLDAGCEYYVYGSDITTTWPVGGKFTPQQRVVYEAVLAAQRDVERAMKPGVAWTDMHALAYRRILEGLLAAGVVGGGSVEELLEADIGGLFMPHGLGHFLGLNTHDVGGYPPGSPARSSRPGFRSLRTSRVLQPGMVITVEPGCYFNPALLMPALQDPVKSKYLVRDAVLSYMAVGGVRLEDNVVVTESGIERLTQVPRSPEEVEAVMAGADWP